MVSPVVGQFQQGDSRSGEVPVQPGPSGPVTTVLVRQMGPGNTWWVLGAGTAAISLTAPAWNDSVTSPVKLTGTGMAYEGTIQTEVREDGNGAPLGQGYVTAGTTAMAPFTGSLTFTRPSSKYGALVLFTTSAQTGHVMEASVLRIRFG